MECVCDGSYKSYGQRLLKLSGFIYIALYIKVFSLVWLLFGFVKNVRQGQATLIKKDAHGKTTLFEYEGIFQNDMPLG